MSNFYGFLGIYEIPWVISQVLTGVAFVIIVNAYNFIDGIDGLAISETIKNLIFFLCILPSSDPFFNLAYILLFISIPFYYFNLKKRKKVFLGDAGSLFLGGINIIFLLHLLDPKIIINAVENSKKILVAIGILLYPICDLTRVVFIRLKNKKSPFTADQNHIHHWFVLNGYSHLKTTLFIIIPGTIIVSLILFI